MRRRLGLTAAEGFALAGVAAFVVALHLLPLLRLLLEAVAPAGRLGFERIATLAAEPATWRATWRSLETSIAGALGAVVIGGALAGVLALTNVRGKLALAFAFMLPLMIPPQITALAWVQMAGPASPLLKTLGLAPSGGGSNPIQSREGIMLLLAVQEAPLAFLILRAALRSLPRELIEAARMAGASGVTIARTIVLPLVWPSILASLALTFVAALGNFGVAAILGIPAGYFTLPTLIYRRLASFGPSVITDVAILSTLTAVIAFAGVALHLWLSRGLEARVIGRSGATLTLPLGRSRLAVEGLLWLALVLLLLLPLSALVVTALVPAYGVPLGPATATLDNFAEVLFRQRVTGRALANSLLLAGSAAALLALIALPLASLAEWRRSRTAEMLAAIAEAPYALPGTVLAIAMILVFLKPLPLVGVTIYGTLAVILVAYLSRFLALALRPVRAGFRQLDPRLEEAARVAGAGYVFRLRTIAAPLLAPVVAAGAILVFLSAFTELTVSALLWSAGTETLGVVVYNLDDGGAPTLAAALSVMIVGLVVALMGALNLLRHRLPAGVLPWGEPGSAR